MAYADSECSISKLRGGDQHGIDFQPEPIDLRAEGDFYRNGDAL